MSTVLEAPPDEQVHNRQQFLQQRVLLLAPSFGCWRGQYVISEDHVDVRVDNTTVREGDVTAPRSNLMKETCPLDQNGKPWKKRFSDIEGQQKRLIATYSVQFPITGVRIIPKARGREFFARLLGPVDSDGTPIGEPGVPLSEQSIAYQLRVAANEFCDSLDDIYNQIARNNPQVWENVKGRVPNAHDMRRKFTVDAVPIELAGGEASQLTAEDLATHHATVRDACQRKVEEAIETMVSGPRAELAEALAGLQELINRDGRVTPKSFGPVRAAIAKMRLFDFVADDTLLAQIGQLERRLDITVPNTLDNVTAANNGFSAALRAVQAEITSSERAQADIERFGRETRAIDID